MGRAEHIQEQKLTIKRENMNGIYGTNIRIVNEREQFRFPRTKKPRIQKKWRKQEKNWRKKENIMMYDQVTNVIYCSPDKYQELKNHPSVDVV